MMMKSYRHNIKGVAAVEFALIAPVLAILIIGVFDFGMYLNKAMNLENTARTAAEYVIQGGDPENLETDVLLPSTLGLTEDTLHTVSIDYNNYICACHDGEIVDCDTGECADEGDYIHHYYEVNLSMSYEPMFSYPGVPHPVTIVGDAVLRTQ